MTDQFFHELERDLVQAASRREHAAAAATRGRRRPRAAALMGTVLLLGLGTSSAAAAFYVMRASPIAPFAEGSSTPEQTVAAGTSRVLDVRAADPDRSTLPWALRLSTSKTGLMCGTVGQVDRDGTFGLVGLDDRFRELPEVNADACGQDPAGRADIALLGMRVFAARRPEDVRTVVNGVGGEDLTSVTVSALSAGARPVRRRLKVSAEGGFVVALSGYPEERRPVIELGWKNGRKRTYRFSDDPFIVPDPLGGRAWKLEAFSMGVAVKPGKPRPAIPDYLPTCVRFLTARPGGGRTGFASSPAVCGMAPAKRGVPDRTLFFDTRRLSGDRDLDARDGFERGDWNGRPARVVVWGSARARRVTITAAPGLRREVTPTVNGAFMAILPTRTDPTSVSVTVTMTDGTSRRFGHRHGLVPYPTVRP